MGSFVAVRPELSGAAGGRCGQTEEEGAGCPLPVLTASSGPGPLACVKCAGRHQHAGPTKRRAPITAQGKCRSCLGGGGDLPAVVILTSVLALPRNLQCRADCPGTVQRPVRSSLL
ncbi:hypothetical protein NDU88_002322 [Pleurodeles waltl]|uniref:Uncharacterized protein n=1 Tax=Pleurodeles waltl TaxID=8319 RepID=A0AAV7VZ17_PLEWA|nr:hypothetical protein NDU88_002322 [Pleurodeles waltl]